MQEKSGTRKSAKVAGVKARMGRPPKDRTLAEEQKVRFFEEDYLLVVAAARAAGTTPSGFIRDAAVAAAKAKLKPRR